MKSMTATHTRTTSASTNRTATNRTTARTTRTGPAAVLSRAVASSVVALLAVSLPVAANAATGDATASGASSAPGSALGVTASAARQHVSYDLDAWTAADSRSAGHQEIVGDRLHVWTDDATSEAKAALYLPTDLGLRDVGEPSLDWENADGFTVAPGLQLVVFVDGAWGGTLVGESLYENSHWWTTSAPIRGYAPDTSGGHGSEYHGTLAQWAQSFEDAGKTVRVAAVGYSLGSGMHGDGYIRSMTFGDTVYTFAEPAATTIVANPPSALAGVRSSLPITVRTQDGAADGTVTVLVDGTSRATGRLVAGATTVTLPALPAGAHRLEVTHTPASARFAAAASLRTSLSVATATAKVAAPSASTTYGTPARVVVSVSSSGASPDGGTVVARADGFVRQGTVKNGKATLTLPAGAAGRQTVTYAYDGNDAVRSAKTTASYAVAKDSSTAKVSVSPSTGSVKTTPKVSVTVTAKGGGKVSGKARITVTSPKGASHSRDVWLSNGKGSLSLGARGKGTHKVSVSYAGDADVKASTAKTTYVVR